MNLSAFLEAAPGFQGHKIHWLNNLTLYVWDFPWSPGIAITRQLLSITKVSPTSISILSNVHRGNHELLWDFFLFLPRLFLPTTHNPAPVIYLCQLALMPARHQMPLLVSRRQPVCTKWCHPRVQLLSWFQSLQQTTDRQWSERLQPRGYPSKFCLFHPL